MRHFRQIPSDEVREHLLQMTKRIGDLEGTDAEKRRDPPALIGQAPARSMPRGVGLR